MEMEIRIAMLEVDQLVNFHWNYHNLTPTLKREKASIIVESSRKKDRRKNDYLSYHIVVAEIADSVSSRRNKQKTKTDCGLIIERSLSMTEGPV